MIAMGLEDELDQVTQKKLEILHESGQLEQAVNKGVADAVAAQQIQQEQIQKQAEKQSKNLETTEQEPEKKEDEN